MCKVKFNQWGCVAVPGYYGNGRKAIELLDALDGEPVAIATVNVVAQELTSENHVFIKDYAENSGMLSAMTEAGLIKPNGRLVPSGFVMIPEAELTEKGLKLFEDIKPKEDA